MRSAHVDIGDGGPTTQVAYEPLVAHTRRLMAANLLAAIEGSRWPSKDSLADDDPDCEVPGGYLPSETK